MNLVSTAEIALLTTTAALLAVLACGIYIEGTKTRLLVHAVLAVPIAYVLASSFGVPWAVGLTTVLAVANLTVWLLMRKFECERQARAAYWQAAGALSGALARHASLRD